MDRVEALRKQLQSERAKSKDNALSAAVKLDVREIADDILRHFRDSTDHFFQARCAWALGKLRYRAAIPSLKDGLKSGDVQIRIKCAWALGEVGLDDLEGFLRGRLEEEHNEGVRMAIGGALKKLRLDSVRAPVSVVETQLRPPATRDPDVRAIVNDLQNLRYPEHEKEIVLLRSKLKAAAPDYFEKYMAWWARRPSVEEALQNPKKVYRDDEPTRRSRPATSRGGKR
ncbi:MAG: hypothetical protein ABSC13_08155 [Dehalococcoidia bacterium]|jgi:HEAT repeat protein